MPFQKGNKLSPGRKGAEIEAKDIKRMISLLKRYLTLGEIIAKGKATDNQKDAFERLRALVLKILDKLLANMESSVVEHQFPQFLTDFIKDASAKSNE